MMGDTNQINKINKRENEKLVMQHNKLVDDFDIERPKTLMDY
jgi:hypothetical protein